jgi:septal ring-binding cell division protein DamX
MRPKMNSMLCLSPRLRALGVALMLVLAVLLSAAPPAGANEKSVAELNAGAVTATPPAGGAGSSPDELSKTGATIGFTLAIGAGLIAGGAALTVLARPRRA